MSENNHIMLAGVVDPETGTSPTETPVGEAHETAAEEAAGATNDHGVGDAHPAEGELHTEVGHAETGFTCAPGLPQMCTDTFPSQIFWLVITFVFLYVMMSRVTLPKIGRVIEERRDRVADEQALAEARSKAHVLAQETRDTLAGEADERKAALEAELDKKLEVASERIAETKTAALSSIREVASDTAAAVVEHILEEAGNTDAIASAVNAELQRRGN